jgi:serine/arginine repetitive matrix protein 2
MRNRNTLPLLSRAVSNSPVPSSSFEIYTADPPPRGALPIPAIRLVQATPSPDSTAADVSVETAPVLTPRDHHPSPRKKLVPKKSKLALLASRATGAAASAASLREKDLSDVVRRVGQGQDQGWGMDQDGACNVTVNGGTARSVKGLGRSRKNQSSRSTIDIYVDPANDPDIGEIVVVRKKKSRAALDGIRWALGEVTNASTAEADVPPKDDAEKVKIKAEEKEKWWSIGRGKRDSKEKEKDTAKTKLCAKGTRISPPV